MNARRATALSAYILLIAAATLTPQPGESVGRVSSFCIACGELGTPDLLLNILLFVPLGVALGSAGNGAWRALAIGFALSAAIEVAQLLIPGRYPTLRDVLLNGLGCGLGVLFPSATQRVLQPSRWSPFWLWTASAAAMLTVAATGWLLRFDPSPGQLFVHWSPRQAHLEPWTGTVLSASVNGWSLEPGEAKEPANIRATLRDDVRLDVRATEGATGGATTTGLAGIVTISDSRQREVLLAGPHGPDLVVRVRRRAAWLRLDAPRFEFTNLMKAVAPNAPFALETRLDWRGGCASVGADTRCTTVANAGSAWTFIRSMPGLAAPWRHALNALTLLLLVLPVGALLSAVPKLHAAVAAVATLLGVALVATWVGLGLPTALEWCGLLGGLVGGLGAGLGSGLRFGCDVGLTARRAMM